MIRLLVVVAALAFAGQAPPGLVDQGFKVPAAGEAVAVIHAS